MNPTQTLKTTFVTALLALSLAFTLAFSLALSAAPKSVVKLPNLELTGSDGKQHHLHDYLGTGKWSTIVVWGPKCPACIEEMPEIQGLYDDANENNINVFGLAVDFPTFNYAKLKQVQQFEEDYFISFPNLLVSANIYYDLGLGALQGTPTVILVNPAGEVSAVQLGGVPRNVIEKFIAKENAKNNLLSNTQ